MIDKKNSLSAGQCVFALVKFLCVVFCLSVFDTATVEAADEYLIRDVASDQNRPWEIVWGPDGYIWYTERHGRVSRVHPDSREHHILLDIQERVSLTHEGGMLGLALDPDFATSPFVYIAYAAHAEEKNSDALYITKWRYNAAEQTLTDEERIFPLSSTWRIHLGCRLLIDSDRTMYISIGDASSNDHPQDMERKQGKTHRINLDGSIPDDNPFPGSTIWSFGHRNHQGLVFGRNGILYSSEHGTDQDDEFNIIKKGGNYGWPTVLGFCDNELEQAYCEANDVVEPLFAWAPTIAVSGIEYYDHAEFPEWQNSVLISTLKNQRIYRMEMSEDGTEVVAEHQMFQGLWGRLRDFAISPEGRLFISATNMERELPFPDRVFELMTMSTAQPAENLPEVLDFGSAPAFEKHTAEVELRASGDDRLILFDPIIEGADAELFAIAPGHHRIVIEPGQSVKLAIEFRATAAGQYSANVRMRSNAAEDSEIQIQLRATAADVERFTTEKYFNVAEMSEPQSETVYLRIPLNNHVPGESISAQFADASSFNITSQMVHDGSLFATLDFSEVQAPGVHTLNVTSSGEARATVKILIGMPFVVWLDESGQIRRNQRLYLEHESKRGFDLTVDLALVNTLTTRAVDIAKTELIEFEGGSQSLEVEARPHELPENLAPNQVINFSVDIVGPHAGSLDAKFALLDKQGDVVAKQPLALTISEWKPALGPVLIFSEDEYPIVVDTVFCIVNWSELEGEPQLNISQDDFAEIKFQEGRFAPGDTLKVGIRAVLPDETPRYSILTLSMPGLEEDLLYEVLHNAIVEPESPVPSEVLLVQPNPVSDMVTFFVSPEVEGDWTLVVHDVNGRAVLNRSGSRIGEFIQIPWNVASTGSGALSAGLYYAELQVGDKSFQASFSVVR